MKTTAAALGLALLLAGCGGDGDDPVLSSTETVCDEFAAHSQAGLPAGERAAVVDAIGEVIDNADQQVQDAFAPLRNSVDGPDSGYSTAADGFAQSCFDSGWDG